MPIPVILWAIGAVLVAGAVIAVAYFTFMSLREWFAQRESIYQKDKDNIAFVVKQAANSESTPVIPGVFRNPHARTRIVQGIVNQREGEVVEARVVEAKEVDSEIAELPEGKVIIIE